MSYCRFSNADAYVFLSCNGHLECCGCLLAAEPGNSRSFTDTASLVAHLIEHVNAGHDIPQDVFDRLEAEREENDVWLESDEAKAERAALAAAFRDSEETK